MKLDLTEDQEFFRKTKRRFIEAVAAVRRLESAEHVFDGDWWRRAANLGWTSMLVAEAAGGGCLSGRPVADAAIVAEEMGRQVSPGPLLPVSVVAPALSTEAGRHTEVLQSLVAGSTVASWAFAEPAGRWDADGIRATAEHCADGVLVSGVKSFVEAASEAEQFLVTARTGEGLTQVVVPAGADGVTVRPAQSLDRARRFGEVRLDQVRLPLCRDRRAGRRGGRRCGAAVADCSGAAVRRDGGGVGPGVRIHPGVHG